MARTFALLIVVMSFGVFGNAIQAEEDSIRVSLDSAKTRFEKESQQIRASVIKELERRDTTARKKGDTVAVQAAKSQREEYDKSGTFPELIPKATTTKLKEAIRDVKKAYEKAQSEYLKSGKDELAASAKEELERVLESADKLRDPVPAGSQWQGPRHGVFPTESHLVVTAERSEE